MMITKLYKRLLGIVGIVGLLGMASCSDEPDAANYYTFTGEMMSDFLKSPDRPQYSKFATIVERAGLMDLLATYGNYTCFVPSNDAVDAFLQKRGLSDLSQLTDADCDTIARTHLVSNMYTTFEMVTDRLPTANLMNRYLATSRGFDNDSNAVIFLEGIAHINFELKDDSVENGIVQPIDQVIEKSNSYVTDAMRDNPRISTFYNALKATGVYDDVLGVVDPDWNPKDYDRVYQKSYNWSEVYWVPDTKKYGYTFFIEPDDLLESKYGIKKGDLRALYELACSIYDEVYPEDVNAPGHSFENLKDSVNPLKRFIQYHILNKYCAGTSDLTPMEEPSFCKGAIGIDESLTNPSDWHYTLLPHTMMKVDQATVKNNLGPSVYRDRYINRRYDEKFAIEGQHIDPTVETEPTHDAVNGHYFYVDDIVAFTKEVQDKVQNVRIRMDFATIFPEIIGNGLRSEGTLKEDDANNPDDSSTPKNGRNYYFPDGYLDGVSFSNCLMVLRRPHEIYNCYLWDEIDLFGDYDITFRLPPVPFSGEWQIRLGYTAFESRGVAQIYLDNIPQGIPLDMSKDLKSDMYLGDAFISTLSDYDNLSAEEKAEQQKQLKNLGACLYPRSIYHKGGYSGAAEYDITYESSVRRILSQSYLDASKDHFLRIRVASDGKKGNNNEFMLDFLELVPKSVFGVDGDGEMEDEL